MLAARISDGRTVTDLRTGAVDDVPLSPVDWNAKLGAPSTLPRDRTVYIVTDECEAHEVRWSYDAKFWTGRDEWYRQDGESGCWGIEEIVGWTETYADADEAAELLKVAAQ